MIAVLFEAMAVAEKRDRYFQLAEQLKPLLSDIDGFISIERFQSTTSPDKFISLSWWKDEEAIKHWKKNVQHKLAQDEGKSTIFSFYKINVLTSTREYCSQ
ncbi:antibiotic biosynthesis monooxygenase [Vibrio parahaemolyticus]|uniref:antibiotic biosynthesis monooxygenase family protein n=1 Tax=Vibrio parahaemolyticus TaxID=670 RepID=UPI00084A36E0|nr:antibiotic biosynthesis monooxygenase [Vibrio parahaemolyticus]EGQ8084604.1 antibiotic biosynthesis monooxygenase [Vibrio parahaemolyticus]EID0732416.1 antibiotic biosynthesis monooxygenase [Vibrio parahaemolyticus]ELA9415569.1 antibiotic biosynthesis monooxygenase [Vibrio parahaemolyticus]ODY17329.1 antibiotic biosynthesis monooxygenase [Vibrio parahaemolyticus]